MHPQLLRCLQARRGRCWLCGALPGLRVPLVKVSPAPSVPLSPDGGSAHPREAACPPLKGSAGLLGARAAGLPGLTGPECTAWWARPHSPLLQTRRLGEHGTSTSGWGRLADALCKTWLKCRAELVGGGRGKAFYRRGAPPNGRWWLVRQHIFCPPHWEGLRPLRMLRWASRACPFGPFRRGLGGVGCPLGTATQAPVPLWERGAEGASWGSHPALHTPASESQPSFWVRSGSPM